MAWARCIAPATPCSAASSRSKCCPPKPRTTPMLAPRILREAKAASRLNHPNIVTVHELGRSDDTEFLVMEYVEGRSLAAVIPSRRPADRSRARLLVADRRRVGGGARRRARAPRREARQRDGDAERPGEGPRFRARAAPARRRRPPKRRPRPPSSSPVTAWRARSATWRRNRSKVSSRTRAATSLRLAS